MRTARAAKRTKAEIAERVNDLLRLVRLVRLEGLERRFPGQISGGQKQRVALARALAVDPKVLLLDEPFGALDANVRRDLRRWLREIHEELGITTLFVTHDQEEALDLADRVVILNEGKIVQQGTPEEICRNPASAFIMRFLGDTNVIETTVNRGRAAFDGLLVDAPGCADGPAEILLRPNDLAWAPNEAGGIPATISRVLDRPGSRRLVALTPSGQTLEVDAEPDLTVALLPRLSQDPAVPGLRTGTIGGPRANAIRTVVRRWLRWHPQSPLNGLTMGMWSNRPEIH